MVRCEKDTFLIELRSDTFTKPTPKMLQEMVSAEVGDAIYDEDPTITKLEKRVADLFGKEASLFMPSGTMANLVAVMVHCNERGSEIIIGDRSHYNLWEQGGVGQIASVYVKQIENLDDGTFDLEKLKKIIPDHSDRCCTRTRLICIENSQNWCGGRILQQDFVEKIGKFCKERDIKLHLDGSRIMNVSAATNTDVSTLCAPVDTINFCFSKGLGAPIGSILIGSKEFIEKAVRVRQSLGGGLRQAGVLAAACLYGLSQANENLKKDNENAKKLVEGLSRLKSDLFSVDVDATETNIVHLKLMKKNLSVPDFIKRLATVTDLEKSELGKSIMVKVGEVDDQTIRMLTHLDVDSDEIDLALTKFEFISREYTKNE